MSETWPRISSALFYDDAARAIDWLESAFGFETRLRIDGEGGRIEHSELVLGDGLIMVGTASSISDIPCRSPRATDGANTQFLCVRVDDADAHCERARAAGARIVEEPATKDYGPEYDTHRTYRAIDPEGHFWCFMQIVEEARPVAG
jgi:uncharacterized glyoxalase superfamily protein PhnB